jgi:cytochrome b561
MNTRPMPLHAYTRAPAVVRADRAIRHHPLTILMHWSSAIAVVLAAGSVLWREWVEMEGLRALLMQVHKQAGLFVLVALVARLAARWAYGFKDHAKPMHPLLTLAAHGAHVSLYLLLFALPMLGLAASAASALDVSFFGLFRVPPMVQDDPDLSATLSEYHILAAWAMLGLLLAHIGAAVWHHRVRRDGVLAAMVPSMEPLEPQQAAHASPRKRIAPKLPSPGEAD